MSNNPNTHPHREIIQAWLDGREVEYNSDGMWFTQEFDDAEFVSGLEYRIKEPKPEPKTWYQAVARSPKSGRCLLIDGLYLSEEEVEESWIGYTVLKLIPVYTEESPE